MNLFWICAIIGMIVGIIVFTHLVDDLALGMLPGIIVGLGIATGIWLIIACILGNFFHMTVIETKPYDIIQIQQEYVVNNCVHYFNPESASVETIEINDDDIEIIYTSKTNVPIVEVTKTACDNKIVNWLLVKHDGKDYFTDIKVLLPAPQSN